MIKKALLFFTLTTIFFTSSHVKAEVFHWPRICDSGDLIIKNNDTVNASVWLQKFNKNLMRESEIQINAKASFVLKLEPLAQDERYALLDIQNTGNFEVKYKCNGRTITASSIEGGTLTFKKTNLTQNIIWLQNLFTGKNTVQFEFFDLKNAPLKTELLELASLQSVLYSVPASIKDWSYFKITTNKKSSIFSLTESGNALPTAVSPQQTQIDLAAAYFLVGPRTGRADSFVVKITDEKTIERARDLILNPQKEKMLFARIQKDHQGFNRNWSKSEKSFWSWSTSEVTNFGDLGSTACNGVPQEVEDRMEYWVADPGQICFWNYRIKKELTPLEVANGL